MIPLDTKETLKSGVYTCGTTGSGKSDIAMYTAKRLMAITALDKIRINGQLVKEVIVIVFDPTQDWMKRSRLEQCQLIRGYYSCAWTPEIPDKSIVYDISELSITQSQNLVEHYCKKIMKQQAETPKALRKNYFIIFEEAHTYFPQGCMMAKRYQNTVRMMTQGRNFGVRFMCITQFSSMIDKKAMRYMKQRYFGATDEPNDVEYITKFFPKAERYTFNRKFVEYRLTTLQAGEFIYKYGKHTELVHIRPFDEVNPPSPKIMQEQTTNFRGNEETELKTEKRQKSNPYTAKSLISLAIAIIWLIAIMVAAGMRPH